MIVFGAQSMFVMLLSFLIACHGQEGPDQGADPTAPVPVKNSKGMEGRIKIAGNIFQVSCDCSEHALQNAASQISSTHKAASCRQPSKLHIFADRVSSVASAKTGTDAVMTSSTLQTRLPDPKSCDIADATKRTLDYTHKKEIKPILGSMGGEIGEFVLALSVYTQILGITDTAKMDVKPYLEQWLNFTKSQGRMFSYQYDVDSIKVLQESVSGLDDRNVLIMKENRPATAQVAPEPELATLILGEGDVDGMKDPAALGNPYLKRLLAASQKKKTLAASDGGNSYGVDGDLVLNVVRQMWKLIWNIFPTDGYSVDARSTVVPRFVGGGAAAAGPVKTNAVVLISSSVGCREKNMVPIVSGRGTADSAAAAKGEAMLILHPGAISARHDELCAFFEKMDTTGHVKKDAMCDALKREFKLHVSLYLSELDALPSPVAKFSVQYV